MEQSSTFPISEELYRPMLRIKEELTKLFAKKFSCHIELKGPKYLAPPGAQDSKLVYEKMMPGGLRVSTWKGDLTMQAVDAVVNAANDQLDHAGGLALALAKAGGPVVELESRRHIKNYGEVKTGSIAVTSAGNLPCRWIIHAVGPMWDRYKSEQCKSELKEVITSVLHHVNSDSCIKSVAIPAVSSGIFGFPLTLCADIIVQVIENFISRVKCDHLQEILLVNNDDKTVEAMKAACENRLGRSDSQNWMQRIAQTASHQAAAPPYVAPAISINGLNLYLKKGNIEEQSTSVIVNSISSDLDLTQGQISNAILKKAGPELQGEIWKYKPNPHTGSVVTTRGCRLPCQFVYHTILSSFTDVSKGDPEQILRAVVFQCLTQAASIPSQGQRSSISFPTLGTGALNFPIKKVAEIMIHTFLQFAYNCPCILDMYLVIHPQDEEAYKVFQNTVQTMSKSYNIRVSAAEQKAGTSSQDEKMCIIICGKSNEDVKEAETFLTQNILVPESIHIQNNHIFLFGKKEHISLSSLQCSRAEISEVLSNGKASLQIKGSQKDMASAAVQVELMLLDAQEEHAEKLEDELLESAVQWMYEGEKLGRFPGRDNRRIEEAYVSRSNTELTISGKQISFDFINFTAKAAGTTYHLNRECLLARDYIPRNHKGGTTLAPLFLLDIVDPSSQTFKDRGKEFMKANLELVKMVKIQNKILTAVYQSKKSNERGLLVYKRVPGDFCKLIARAGFNRLYLGSGDAEHEGGICFSKQLDGVLEDPAGTKGMLYIFQAEVASSNPTDKWNMLPTPLASDMYSMHDSYMDSLKNPKKVVIFDGHRANPQCWFTCKWLGSKV